MAYSVTITDGTVKELQNDRYWISYNLQVTDDSPAATLYDSEVGVRWDGDNDWTELRMKLGVKMQAIVDRVVDERNKIKSVVYSNIKTWLNNNVSA